MLLRITHETIYEYPAPVSDSYMEARLRPWSDADQGCAEYALRVEPEARVASVRTPSAWVEFFNVLAPHERLRLVSEALVIAQPRNPFERIDLRGGWSRLREESFRARFWEHLQPPADPEVREAAQAMIREVKAQTGDSAAAFVIEMARQIHDTFAYEPGATTVSTPLVEVLAHRRGVCQDFSHLMLAVLQIAGIPARYVSGYLYVPERPLGAEHGSIATDGAMHAWVEAFLPGSGWVGVDPTHGLLADHHYIKVGVGHCYGDVPPTRGVYRGRPEHTMTSRVRVTALAQDGEERKGAYFAISHQPRPPAALTCNGAATSALAADT
jgi:transglutaminase-like putative cysteine protease